MGRDHPDTLLTRHNIAGLLGESDETGDWPEALELFEALLADMFRVLGNDHPSVLKTRNSIAGLTGQSGEPREALRLFQPLLHDQCCLAKITPILCWTRFNIAAELVMLGELLQALRLFRVLPGRILESVFVAVITPIRLTRSLGSWTGVPDRRPCWWMPALARGLFASDKPLRSGLPGDATIH